MSFRGQPVFKMKTRTHFAAKHTFLAVLQLKRKIRIFKSKIFEQEIAINRQNLPKQFSFQTFDMINYIEQTNAYSNRYWYIFGFIVSFYLSFKLAMIFYDSEFRYYLFVRYPRQMLFFEQQREYFSKQMQFFHQEYLGGIEIPQIRNAADYYNFTQNVSEVIFKTQKKREQEKKDIEVLNVNATEIDKSMKKIDEVLASEDIKIKAIQHKLEE